MRVAFSGASGTGKTTLARWVAEEFNLELNPVGSRSVAAEMGLASGYEADQQGRRKEFSERLIQTKRDWEEDHDEFVTDRSVFDDLTYAALSDVGVIEDDLLESCVVGMARYSHLIFNPIEVMQRLADDPTRQDSKAYNTLFEALLRGLIKQHADFDADSMIYLLSPVLEHRKTWIRGFLGGKV